MLSPVEQNGAYFSLDMYRIALLGILGQDMAAASERAA